MALEYTNKRQSQHFIKDKMVFLTTIEERWAGILFPSRTIHHVGLYSLPIRSDIPATQELQYGQIGIKT